MIKLYVAAIVAVVVAGAAFVAWQAVGRNPGNASQLDRTAKVDSSGVYDYTEAPDHIGEEATVKGTVLKVFTAKSGVTFLDFCKGSGSCPFSAVIFKEDLEKFGDVAGYAREVSIAGIIRSYQGTAEIVLSDPGQIE